MNRPPHTAEIHPVIAGRLMRLATYASVSTAGILIVVKSLAWLATDSVSLLSTLADSLLDAFASLVNLFAVHHALQPADREHRFGHGKAEALAGLAQAAFVTGSAVFLLMAASRRFLQPKAIENSEAGFLVMAIAIAMTLLLVLFQRLVVRKTGSTAIRADSLHYQTDLLVNVSVMVSLVLATRLGLGWADPLFAVGIALYILKGAWQIGRTAYEILMDRELPENERARIRTLALDHPAVAGVHDLRTRFSGTQKFIQVHIEMKGDISLRRAHDIAEEVMESIENAFSGSEVLIHMDPEGVIERRPEFE